MSSPRSAVPRERGRGGCVGAGTGMQCFDFKGGIGTASGGRRHVQLTVGVLVCTNFGARPDLRIAGVPVGLALTDLMPEGHAAGSCIVVVATDAPITPPAPAASPSLGLGLARCGSIGASGSGELMLAFSRQLRPFLAHRRGRDRRALLDGAFWHRPARSIRSSRRRSGYGGGGRERALRGRNRPAATGTSCTRSPGTGSSRCWIAPEGGCEAGFSGSDEARVASWHTSGARSAAGVSAEYHPKVGVANADRPMQGWVDYGWWGRARTR
jgi:hypothetical protein